MIRNPRRHAPQLSPEAIVGFQTTLVIWNGYGLGCGMDDDPRWEHVDETNMPEPEA